MTDQMFVTPVAVDPPFPTWRQRLLTRLERGMGRPVSAAERSNLVWNEAAGTLTVYASPLLSELRARGVASNVFRSHVS